MARDVYRQIAAAIASALLLHSSIHAAGNPLPKVFSAPRQIRFIQPDGDLPRIRIVDWNIDRGRHWDTIAGELSRAPADLCLFQEVDWNTKRTNRTDVAAKLAQRLRLNAVYAIEFEELSQESNGPAFIGQATLTRLPIRNARILRFKHQSSFWKPRAWMPSSLPLFQRRLGSRIALVTELEFAGHLLVVYNTHLESRSLGKIQSQQLDEIFADLKRYPPDTAVILGGDLNTKYFASRFLKKLEGEGFRSVTGQRIERTHTIAMALDWIFAKGPLAIESGGVRRDLSGSDHYPIYAELVRK